MGASPGWQTTIKVSGTSTAMTAEATDDVGKVDGRDRRQVSNSAKRILDPDVALTVKDDGSAVADADIYSIDMQFGIVTFKTGYVFAGDVTVDGSYLPVSTVAEGRAVSLSLERVAIDTTTYDSAVAASGGRRHSLGLLGVSVTLELYAGDDADLDPGSGTAVLQSLLEADTPKLLEVQFQPGWYVRSWVKTSELGRTVEAEGIMKKSLTFVGCARSATGYSQNAWYSFGQ